MAEEIWEKGFGLRFQGIRCFRLKVRFKISTHRREASCVSDGRGACSSCSNCELNIHQHKAIAISGSWSAGSLLHCDLVA